MRQLASKAIASVCGIGFIKGGGSVAALLYCIVWLLLPVANILVQGFVLVTVLIAGILCANACEADWGHDSNKIVIDEVAGMMVTLFTIPLEIKYVVIGFVLFRFFDILKPLAIRKAENLPGGWGVMADDLLAGVYSLLLLKLVIAIKIL